MREDIVKWVAALRSGDYRQGYDSLNHITPNGQSYCCLGVYKKVCLKTFDPLPYAQVYDQLGYVNCQDFMKANDSRHVDFNEMADIIEERFAMKDL